MRIEREREGRREIGHSIVTYRNKLSWRFSKFSLDIPRKNPSQQNLKIINKLKGGGDWVFSSRGSTYDVALAQQKNVKKIKSEQDFSCFSVEKKSDFNVIHISAIMMATNDPRVNYTP
jgi:hypothetical protein